MGLGKERWSGDEAGFWSRERTVALALFLLTTLALAVCFMVLRPFLAPLAWAVALRRGCLSLIAGWKENCTAEVSRLAWQCFWLPAWL